jgi:hypothetical protein
MSVNTWLTGKQEADNISKHVGYRKLTISVNTWVTGS